MSGHDEDERRVQQAAGAGSNLSRTAGSEDDNMDAPGTAGGFDPGTGGTGRTGTAFDEVGGAGRGGLSSGNPGEAETAGLGRQDLGGMEEGTSTGGPAAEVGTATAPGDTGIDKPTGGGSPGQAAGHERDQAGERRDM